MALRWRFDGLNNGSLICAAKSFEEKGDHYIDDEVHYKLAVILKVVVPDINESNNGLWYWVDEL